jgi:cytochrome c oxidase subunit III
MMNHDAVLEQKKIMESDWGGGRAPFGVSWRKYMMWIFIVSDAFTFGAFLAAYGMFRITSAEWPNTYEVFTAFPLLGEVPMLFVATMTFILICSSFTMALAVSASYKNDRAGALKYLLLTILGGSIFLMCQAYEWYHIIHDGATLTSNPWGVPLFSATFFMITGFHGMHVLSGLILLVITALKVNGGFYEKRGSYEGVEIVGLYWHFVDLVWVFVFTFFYLL